MYPLQTDVSRSGINPAAYHGYGSVDLLDPVMDNAMVVTGYLTTIYIDRKKLI